MDPQFIDKPEMTLVGMVSTAASVHDMDIYGLWQRFGKHTDGIKHQVEGKAYEIHIDGETSPGMHFCLCGVEVGQIEKVPAELFVKPVPACRYAVFTHQFKDGGFDTAFTAVYDWIEHSDYVPAYPFDLQCYDSRFKSPNDPESIVEIYVPVQPKKR